MITLLRIQTNRYAFKLFGWGLFLCSAEAIDFVYLSLVHRKEEQNRVVYSNHWISILNVISSLIDHIWSVIPSAIAGVHFFQPWSILSRSDLCGLTKLYQAWKKSSAWVCRPEILLQFMLLRTKPANELRIVRFSRSIYEILILLPESSPSNCGVNPSEWTMLTAKLAG